MRITPHTALAYAVAYRPGRRHLQYDAPELIVDGKQADKKSDVYSFGVVMWELSLRRRPFDTLATRVGMMSLYAQIASSYQKGEGLSMTVRHRQVARRPLQLRCLCVVVHC